MLWSLKKYFLFCDDKIFYFLAKYLGTFYLLTIYQQMATITVPESSKKFRCETCDYCTSRKSQYDRHLTTEKHMNQQMSTFVNEKVQESSTIFECNCGKKYKDRTGLWKHKKKCSSNSETFDSDENKIIYNNLADKDELILMLIKQNSALIKETTEFKSMMVEQQSMMMEVIKNGTHNTNTINNTNSHNKAFNLNLFLNETCKDAMNINDFVESIKLQVSDLENVGEVGFVEGISNIIVKNLNALDITKRPIHCTDKKRETIYIKDENTWEKDESQCKMRKMIKKVVSKNQRLIPKFKEQNPEYNKSYSKVSDKYNKLIIESMGGSGDNDLEKEDKIIRNITKNIVVDKSV